MCVWVGVCACVFVWVGGVCACVFFGLVVCVHVCLFGLVVCHVCLLVCECVFVCLGDVWGLGVKVDGVCMCVGGGV